MKLVARVVAMFGAEEEEVMRVFGVNKRFCRALSVWKS